MTVNGVYKPTYNWGAPSCTRLWSFDFFEIRRHPKNLTHSTAGRSKDASGKITPTSRCLFAENRRVRFSVFFLGGYVGNDWNNFTNLLLSPSLPTRRRGMSASLAMRAKAPPRMHGLRTLRTDYDDVPQLPICSMYGIFTNICPKNHPNVGKYTIHGAYGMAYGLYGHKLGYTVYHIRWIHESIMSVWDSTDVQW